jgi:DNA polymerase-3 subunit delta'
MKINEIIGHNEQLEQIIRAYKKDRLAHAYLFYGPDGIGKKTAAMALTKYIFCENTTLGGNESEDSCSYCASCRKIEASNHPDLILIRPERSVIKIDMVRALQKKLRYGKYDAKYKICLIDEAEKMRVEAANALLKTLEEPAADVIIILVTSKVNMLLPTIVSRCQKIRFNPLKTGEIKKELISRHSLTSDEADIISMFLQGSFAKLDTADFNEIIELRRRLVKKITALSLNNVSDIIGFCSEIGKTDKELLVETVEIIKTFYADAAMLKNSIKDNFVNKDIIADISALASNMTQDEIFEKINIMNQIQSSLMANVNKKLAIESMLIKLSA